MTAFDLHFQHRFADLALDIALSGGPGVTAVFGPSGAGKTSLIRAVAGLLRPQSGYIRLSGRSLFDSTAGVHLKPQARKLGYVFQDARLMPHLTVAQNLHMGRHGPAPMALEELADLLGITLLLGRLPAGLSGGEAQRVALGRALLSGADMLLMDEPLAALDGPRKDAIMPYLDRLKARAGVPILYVTHSMDEIARLADQVALMANGEIRMNGPVFDVLADPRAIPFIGVREAGSVLRATVRSHGAGGLTELATAAGPILLPGVSAGPGEEVRLRILARDVLIATRPPQGLSARNILPAVVERLDPGRGPGLAVVLRLGDQALLARITSHAQAELQLEPGQDVFVILKASAVARGDIGS